MFRATHIKTDILNAFIFNATVEMPYKTIATVRNKYTKKIV